MSTGRIVIIGGGVTGLTAARLLSPHAKEVIVLETSNRLGGLCRTNFFGDIPFDICGGHIFNTINQQVRDFVFSLTPEDKWSKLKRNAKIWIDDSLIGFPFENNMVALGDKFYYRCLEEMQEWAGLKTLANPTLSSYLLSQFGPTACKKYHFPYNEKLWQYPLDKIGTQWISKGKIPISSIEQVKQANLIGGASDTSMVHSEFYYPKNGGIEQAIINPLLNGDIDIKIDATPVKIQFQSSGFKIVYYSLSKGINIIDCDLIINTAQLDTLLKLCGHKGYNLPTHGTDILVCRSDFFLHNPEVSWTYVPEKKHWWHRMANISYNISLEQDYMMVEAPGGTYKNSMTVDLLDYRFEIKKAYKHSITYPTEPFNKMHNIHKAILDFKKLGIFTLGRWGKHRYMNIDKCIGDVIGTMPEILERL